MQISWRLELVPCPPIGSTSTGTLRDHSSHIWLVVSTSPSDRLKNDGVKVNGKDAIPCMTWKIIKHLWNHQPDRPQHIVDPGSPGWTNGKHCPSSCSLIDLSSMSVFVRALALRELWHCLGVPLLWGTMKFLVTWKIIKAEFLCKKTSTPLSPNQFYTVYTYLCCFSFPKKLPRDRVNWTIFHLK